MGGSSSGTGTPDLGTVGNGIVNTSVNAVSGGLPAIYNGINGGGFSGVAGSLGGQGPLFNGLPGQGPNSGQNSPWQPTGTQPTVGPLADTLNRAPDGSIVRNQLAPGLGEQNEYVNRPLGQLESMTSPDAMTKDSPWAQSQFNQIDRQTAGMRDAAHQNMLSSVQGASDQAASHGGLTGGGAARIGAMGMMNEANADQGASLYGANAHDATRATDYSTKVGILQQLPAAELAKAQNAEKVQGDNTNFIQSGDQMVNNNTLTKYGEDMKTYIGNNLASATAASGKRK